MEQTSFKIAAGEKIVRQCDYLRVEDKRSVYTRVDSYTLTNKRLISRSVIRGGDTINTDVFEIPISDIDTVKTFYRREKKPFPFWLIVLSAIVFVSAVFMLFSGQTVTGIVALAVFAVALILGIVLRKEQFKFSIDVGRLKGRRVNDHLTTGAATVKSNFELIGENAGGEERRGASVVSRLVAALFFGAILFLIVYLLPVGAGNGRGFQTETLLYIGGFVFLLALPVSFGNGSRKRKTHSEQRRKKAKAAALGYSMKRVRFTIASDAVIAFLDELGALIENCKNQVAENETGDANEIENKGENENVD